MTSSLASVFGEDTLRRKEIEPFGGQGFNSPSGRGGIPPIQRFGSTPGAEWTVKRLQDDPVQIGPICMDGPKCLDGARNLLDFIDVRIDPALGAVVAYPDGCEDPCAWPYESRDAFLRIAAIPLAA